MTAGNCISFNVTGTTGIDTVVLTNIFAPVFAAGEVSVSLNAVPLAFTTAYLTPSDNFFNPGPNPGLPAPSAFPSTSVNSDVNVATPPFITTPVAEAAQLPNRVGGSNRADTAAKVATSMGCQVGVGAGGYAVLVNGNSYPDALSSTYLAGAIGAQFFLDVPILLTNTNSVPDSTVQAIRQLGIRSVFIVGGTSVVSEQIEDQLADTRAYTCGGEAFFNDQNLEVRRFAGADRYETNNVVVEASQSIYLGTFNNRLRYQADATSPSKRTALVATGENFADALVAGPFAYGVATPFGPEGFPADSHRGRRALA